MGKAAQIKPTLKLKDMLLNAQSARDGLIGINVYFLANFGILSWASIKSGTQGKDQQTV